MTGVVTTAGGNGWESHRGSVWFQFFEQSRVGGINVLLVPAALCSIRQGDLVAGTGRRRRCKHVAGGCLLLGLAASLLCVRPVGVLTGSLLGLLVLLV